MKPKPMEERNPHLAFMYGTLKSTEPNHRQLFAKGQEGSIFIGQATTVSRFPLIITTPYNIPFLLHKEGTGNQIEGELYRVNDETLKHLDWFEGHPHWYERRKIHVKQHTDNDGNDVQPTVVECWLYGLPRFKTSLLELPLLHTYHNKDPSKFQPYNPDKDGPLNHYLFDE